MLPTDRIPTDAPTPRPAAVHCVVGDTLCEVRIFGEAEWEAIPPGDRPSPAEYFPGLGWVAPTMPGRSGPGAGADRGANPAVGTR